MLLKHSASNFHITFKCKLCYKEYLGFYAFRQRKNTQRSCPIKSTYVETDDIINEVDDTNLKQELRSCQHFLVDSELEIARHKILFYAAENLNKTIVKEKLDRFFDSLEFAAKKNSAFGLFLKNMENGGFI